jgi:hypothetical protein
MRSRKIETSISNREEKPFCECHRALVSTLFMPVPREDHERLYRSKAVIQTLLHFLSITDVVLTGDDLSRYRYNDSVCFGAPYSIIRQPVGHDTQVGHRISHYDN